MVSNVKYERKKWIIALYVIGLLIFIYMLLWRRNAVYVVVTQSQLDMLDQVCKTWAIIGVVLMCCTLIPTQAILRFTVDGEFFEIRIGGIRNLVVGTCYLHNGTKIYVPVNIWKNAYPITLPNGKSIKVDKKATVALKNGRCVEMWSSYVWVDGILVINNGNQVVSELPAAGNTAGSAMSGNPVENVSGNVAVNTAERTAQRTEEDERTTPRQNSPVYFLKCVAGVDQGKRYRLTGKHIIGRDAARCDLVLSQGAAEVSRVHCRIEVRQGRIFLMDMGSSNGTFLGDRRVESNVEHVLPIGTTVTLGTAERFVVEKR